MKTHKIHITPLLCAVAFFVLETTVCEITIGQVEGASMQPVDTPVRLMSDDTTTLLQLQDIKRDLELTPDQIDQLSKVRLQYDTIIKDAMAEYRQRAREMEPAERAEFMRELAAKRKQSREEMDAEIGNILLPFQLKRMEQIKAQNQIARMGPNGGSPILHPMFRDKLKLTKEQEERIRAKMQEMKKKLDDEIAKMQKKANDEILKELTAEQREIYDDMIGEPLKKPTEIDK